MKFLCLDRSVCWMCWRGLNVYVVQWLNVIDNIFICDSEIIWTCKSLTACCFHSLKMFKHESFQKGTLLTVFLLSPSNTHFKSRKLDYHAEWMSGAYRALGSAGLCGLRALARAHAVCCAWHMLRAPCSIGVCKGKYRSPLLSVGVIKGKYWLVLTRFLLI